MNKKESKKKILTTSHGIPVGDNQHSTTAGATGPTVFEDVYLIEKHAHFNRERIPERVVHANGGGAFGYFEVTRDVTKYSKASFLSKVGKRTEAVVRFSTVAGSKGSADTVRDPRGFALKLYTDEGIYDLVMNNTPVFFIRDGMKFPDFIHSQKPDPASGLKSLDSIWDFFSNSPESLHQVVWLYGDRGIPYSWINMNGYSGHTFKWVNSNGKAFWVRYHFKTDQGIKNMSVEEAEKMAGKDPDFHKRQLYEAVRRGKYPSWTAYVQIMPYDDAWNYRYNPFDITKVWPHGDYPLKEIGRLVLNRNPENYFAEIEQLAFSPGNVVPGVEFSPDKMLQVRVFSYADAQRYRLGVNYTSIPVNAPKNQVNNPYYRDGFMAIGKNGGGEPNYEPNTLGGPTEDARFKRMSYQVNGKVGSWKQEEHAEDDDFAQARKLYRIMGADERKRLVSNIGSELKRVRPEIAARQIGLFYRVDSELGKSLEITVGVKSEE